MAPKKTSVATPEVPTLRRSSRAAAAKAAVKITETIKPSASKKSTKAGGNRVGKKSAKDATKNTKGTSKSTAGNKKSGENTDPKVPGNLRRGRSAGRATSPIVDVTLISRKPRKPKTANTESEPPVTGPSSTSGNTHENDAQDGSTSSTPSTSDPPPANVTPDTETITTDKDGPSENNTPPPSSNLGKRKNPSQVLPDTSHKRPRVEPEAPIRSIWAALKQKGRKTPSPRKIRPAITVPAYSNPARNPCGHPMHPAYAGTAAYADVKCPRCRMQVCLQDLRNVQEWIAFGGGIVAIRDRCTAYGTRDTIYHPLVKGMDRRGRRAGLLDAWNKDLSLRQSQIRLANLVLELEPLSKAELDWEKHQTAEARNSSAFRDVRTRRLHSATSALARYKAEREDGSLFPAIEQEAADLRKRCLDKQTVDGLSEGEIEALTTTSSQGPGPNPKRKRRCETARVSINPNVYVRCENDIDVLRKADYSRPVGLPQPVSVLRTAPPPQAVPSSFTTTTTTSTTPSQTNESPRQTAWLPLPRKSANFWYKRDSLQASHQSEFNRPGTAIVDTSGSTSGRASFLEWDAHVKQLQNEAQQWDLAEAREKQEKEEEEEEEEEEAISDFEGSDTEPDTDTEEEIQTGGLGPRNTTQLPPPPPPQNIGSGRSLFDM